MSRRLSLLVSLLLAVPALDAAPLAEKINPEDEKLLKAAKVATDGPALLDYFRKRTMTPKEREQMDRLIRLLGDDSFKVREKASEDLLALGAGALPPLRRALNDPDEEIRERAREGIAAVESKTNPPLSSAVVRILRVRAPAETIKTLLAYLPDAENDAVADEVMTTLAVLGVKENKVDVLLVEALKDKQAAHRAAAALVLGRSGTVEQRRAVQTLLSDKDLHVRFRAAQGLLAGRDRSAIPTFIALLTDGPPELATRAEEMLSCIAAGHAPHTPMAVTDNGTQRRLLRNAWEQWWKQNARIDLSRADVDLPPFNATLRARETARQFAAAILASDKDKLDKLLEVPFHMLGEQTYSKRDQTEQYLANLMQTFANRGVALVPAVQGTKSLEEYLKTAQPSEQPQLTKMRKNDVRIVLLQWSLDVARLGAVAESVDVGDLAVFVRVTGEQPQVFAIGHRRLGNGLMP